MQKFTNKIWWVFMCCIWISNSYATNLDSLWNIWNNNSIADTNRLEAMHVIARDGYLFSQPDSAYYFASLEYDLAQFSGHIEWMAKALNMQGASWFLQSNYQEAMKYYERGLNIRLELNDKKGIAESLRNIGVTYHDQGNTKTAVEYYNKCLEISKKINDTIGIAACYNNIGIAFKTQGNYKEALTNYNKSLKVWKLLNVKQEIATAYNYIGQLFKKQNKEKALYYFLKSLEI